MHRTTRFFIIILLLMLASTPGLVAATSSRLDQLNTKIADIKSTLWREQSKRSEYLQQLKKTEVVSGKILSQLKKAQQDLQQQQQLLKALEENTTRYQHNIDHQQQQLNQQLRAAYVFSRQPYLKLILNQSAAADVSRLLTYYQYLNQNRVLAIEQLQSTLSELQGNQQHLRAQTQVLEAMQKTQKDKRNQLTQIQRHRHRVLQQLNNEIHNKHQKLTQLLANKRLLEQTLHGLQQKEEFQANPDNFARLKGRLSWPTRGDILPYFGTKIYQSQLTWEAILIQAREDEPVYSIADGQVVFAKWLPGYGLLLIINHGHGYMTLYGRNHTIYKKSGDFVHAGDLIATVGDSGGYDQPALYFAIRHNAIPLNPMYWCSKKA